MPKPILPTMKCVCEIIDPDIRPGDVTHFIPTFQTPSICISLEKSKNIVYNKTYAVPCKGFQRTPSAYGFEEYGGQGVDMDALTEVANFERSGKVGGVATEPTPPLHRSIHSYIFRENFTEWPALAKWLFVTPKMNSCQQKGVTPVPISVTDASPWFLNSGDGGERFTKKSMCQPWNTTHSWCPSAFNPLQEPIARYDPEGNYVSNHLNTFLVTIPTCFFASAFTEIQIAYDLVCSLSSLMALGYTLFQSKNVLRMASFL